MGHKFVSALKPHHSLLSVFGDADVVAPDQLSQHIGQARSATELSIQRLVLQLPMMSELVGTLLPSFPSHGGVDQEAYSVLPAISQGSSLGLNLRNPSW